MIVFGTKGKRRQHIRFVYNEEDAKVFNQLYAVVGSETSYFFLLSAVLKVIILHPLFVHSFLRSNRRSIVRTMSLVERIPRDLRNLRACLLCSLIKSFDEFEMNGCDNCEYLLGMKHNRHLVYDCTSNNFEGMTAVVSPEESWVSKWLRVNTLKPGIYAISVSGKLPMEIVRELKARDVHVKNRDRSIK